MLGRLLLALFPPLFRDPSCPRFCLVRACWGNNFCYPSAAYSPGSCWGDCCWRPSAALVVPMFCLVRACWAIMYVVRPPPMYQGHVGVGVFGTLPAALPPLSFHLHHHPSRRASVGSRAALPSLRECRIQALRTVSTSVGLRQCLFIT
jgi:hypothetical protein